jgi:hypothetical protein
MQASKPQGGTKVKEPAAGDAGSGRAHWRRRQLAGGTLPSCRAASRTTLRGSLIYLKALPYTVIQGKEDRGTYNTRAEARR